MPLKIGQSTIVQYKPRIWCNKKFRCANKITSQCCFKDNSWSSKVTQFDQVHMTFPSPWSFTVRW